MAATSATPPTDSRPGDMTRFRPDIEGLRGVAILLVLLFHAAGSPTGGFVGVDVFIVISGFLITALLLRELEQTGGVDLIGFYARRMRRLLPAAAVVVLVVLPAAFVALPPLDRVGAVVDGAASILLVANIRFALADGDYFSSIASPSPFLHFWSLSLEEQFYLLWPVLLLLLVRGRYGRLIGAVGLLALFAGSFASSLVMVDTGPTWGFYSLPGRAWQFVAGGLLAFGPARLGKLPAPIAVIGGWAAAVLLAASAVSLDRAVPYPGILALVPTAAAVVLIATGGNARGPGALLRTRPLRFLGRISYSLYLWHWPLLVLPAAALGSALEPAAVASLTALSIVVAWVSWWLLERPAQRRLSPIRVQNRPLLRLGVAAMAALLCWSGTLGVLADAAITPSTIAGEANADAQTVEVDDAPPVAREQDAARIRAVRPADAGEASASTRPGNVRDSAATLDEPMRPASGRANASAGATDQVPWTKIPRSRLDGGVRLPRDVQPSLVAARTDQERLVADGCFTGLDGLRPASCVYGERSGSMTVVLIGDSHASHWFPAINVLARRHGWRLVPFVKASCPFVDMPVLHPFVKREFTECSQWRERAIAAANDEHADLVIVASAHRGVRAARLADAGQRNAGRAMGREIGRLRSPVAIIVDNPRNDVDIPACLSKHPRDVHACAISRDVAFGPQFGVMERVAARRSHAAIIDVTASICPSTPCPVVLHGMLPYRDTHHLTATFVRSLAPAFDVAIDAILRPAAPVAAAREGLPTAPPASGPAPVAAPGIATATLPVRAPSGAIPAQGALVFERDILAGARAAGGGLEPIVATDPGNSDVMVVAYQRRRAKPACSGAALEARISVSLDGGRTWRNAARTPWRGSDRISSYHSAVALGPAPEEGRTRLYWAGTTTRACGGDLRVATAWSDDLGRTWSKLRPVTGTPPWVGGTPDIAVDRNPNSPHYGTVWLTYNFPASRGAGAGVRVMASTDHGRTWRAKSVRAAALARGATVAWRFGYRVRTGPDGTAYVSWYQADLRRWDPADVFDRGGPSNVRQIGFAVARLELDEGRLRASTPVLVHQLDRNAWTRGERPAPGTGSHTYVDPMWTHGLDIDPLTGTLYVAFGEYRTPAQGRGPRGAITVGRSADRGRTWAWTDVPAPRRIGGRRQSAFRPTIAARGGVVVVGMRTIDEVRASAGALAGTRIGAAWATSVDGGASFLRPVHVRGSRWRASLLQGALNGPGIRDRIDLVADGTAVFAYGDARGRGASSIFIARIGLPEPAMASHGGGGRCRLSD